MLTEASVVSGPIAQSLVARIEAAIVALRANDAFHPIHVLVPNHVLGTLLARLRRLCRIESASVIIEELFARTRALSASLMTPSAIQRVANLGKVLEGLWRCQVG